MEGPLFFIPSDIRSAANGAFRAGWEIWKIGGRAMGTSWSLTLAQEQRTQVEEIRAAVERSIETVIAQMSPWESDSDPQRFQQAKPNSWVPFRPEAFRVLQRSLEIAAESNGVYDPTFAQAIDLLGFGPSPYCGYKLDSQEVVSALSEADYTQLKLNQETGEVWQPSDLGIDLCSIAKGFAVDLAMDALRELMVRNCVFEIGGDARGIGCKPDGSPWVFEIERGPGIPSERAEMRAALCGIALASSGNYLQFRNQNGLIQGHLVEKAHAEKSVPVTSVSVFSSHCMDADAYATALYLLGAEKGLALAEEQHIAAIFQLDSEDLLSSAAKKMLD